MNTAMVTGSVLLETAVDREWIWRGFLLPVKMDDVSDDWLFPLEEIREEFLPTCDLVKGQPDVWYRRTSRRKIQGMYRKG